MRDRNLHGRYSVDRKPLQFGRFSMPWNCCITRTARVISTKYEPYEPPARVGFAGPSAAVT